ncbi:MAG: tetratricopeptide repeat protein [Gammaproteobacteria bacterium]|jgi:Tfp pilus assembly protein PilF|nr:tetratricopeptide repeat protein [Gammaproteobacteria bacterium]
MDPKIIERMIDDGRDTYESRLAAGQARLKAGDVAEAVAHLEKATGHKPEHTMAWQELGKALEKLGQPEAARTAWDRGLASARANGDKQAEKVLTVFLRRLDA